ncbi:MAG: RNA 2',3'-cyclic phosphodiesterase [Thermoanaerobaculia bacterium]
MRLFVAASFPDAVTQELNRRVLTVKPKLGPASYVRPETQHLTFAFLGEQDESLLPTLGAEIERRLRSTPPFEARFRGCGFFPNARRARVGWIGLEPEKPFFDVAGRVREGVTAAGIELDEGHFRPHLTIMRLRDPWPHACIETFEKGLGSYESEPFTVDSVTLYSSKLNPSGAIHTAVRTFALA